MGFDTVFPTYVYIVFAVLIVLSLGVTWRRYMGVLSSSYLSGISICRLLAVVFAFLFVLRPYTVKEQPDLDSFNIGVLVDVSGSMESADCEGVSRLKAAQNFLQEENSWFKKQSNGLNVVYQTFSSQLQSYPANGELTRMVGGTDIQKALEKMYDSAGRGSLGAVVLLSDGQENSGSATEAAKLLRASGVKVTSIGFGGEKELDDVNVAFYQVPKTVNKNKEFEVMARISKNLDAPLKTELVLSSEGQEVARKSIELLPGKNEELVAFKLREYTPGFKNYRIAVAPVQGEMITTNNVDYSAVKITEDEKIRILYFSGNLNPEYKFLDKLCDDSENMQMTALVRTGEKAWYYYAGKTEKTFTVFPDTTELLDFDLIIFDLGAEYLIDQKIAKNLERFAFDKGAGLLFLGRKEQKSLFDDLLPVTEIQRTSSSGKKVLGISENSLLVPRSKKDLTDLSNLLFIKSGSEYYASSKGTLKASARPDLSLKGSKAQVILSSLYYGAGRTAYLGVETWPWKMNPKNSGADYDTFWKRLLTWLSSSSVEQLKIIPAYRNFPVGSAMDLAVDLLEPNFEPSHSARVSAVLKSPSGKITNLKLPASLDIEGRYGFDFIPEEVGEYTLSVEAKFDNDTQVRKKVSFLSSEASGENATLPLNSRLLKDISRITGGKYYLWNNTPGKLELSDNIPVLQTRTFLFNSWLTLIAILSFFCMEWFLRRRIGLR